MSQATVIDTKMHGLDEITGAFLVAGEKTALIETGPKSSVESVQARLDDLGVDRLDWIIVTHIHLDHAGAAGTLAARYPEAKVGVHEVGAPHLVDPTKLWASASRIYGDEMESLWGGIDPLPEDRVEAIRDGDEIDLGGRKLRALETPGHAYHHHAFVDDETETIFTGDTLGVRLPGIEFVRPATPPPEFHLIKAIESIEVIANSGASRLCPTHFGPVEAPVRETCDRAIESLERWAAWVREGRSRSSDLDEVARYVAERAREQLQGSVGEPELLRLEQTTSFWMNTWGYMRYIDKNEV